MFSTTRELLSKTWNDIKFLVKLPGRLEPFIFVFAILYQVYMIFADNSLTYVHVALLILLIANFGFRLVIGNVYESSIEGPLSKQERKLRQKSLKAVIKTEKRIYKILTHAIRAFLIGTSVYSIILTPSAIKIIATIIIAAEWVIEVLVHIASMIVERRFTAICDAFAKDWSAITDTVSAPIQKATEAVKTTVKSALGFFSKFKKGAKDSPAESEEDTETV